MTYTIIISKKGKDLVFKGIDDFVIEPGRAKIRIDDWKEHSSEWHTIEGAERLTLYKDDKVLEEISDESEIHRCQ